MITSRTNAAARRAVYAPPIGAPGVAACYGDSPVRTVGFPMAAAFAVVRFGMLHQLLAYLIHTSLYLHLLFGLPSVLCVFLSGGLRRVFQGRTAFYWTAYAVWLFVAVPFSAWKGESFQVALGFFRADYIVMLAIAGLTVTWGECKSMMRALSWGALAMLLIARLFATSAFGRVSLAFGTVSNSNDIACALVLMLPFLLWVALSSQWIALRLAVLPGIAYGMYVILTTGSRGAALGLLVQLAIWLLMGTMRQRIVLLTAGAVIVSLVVAMAPKEALDRIMTTFSTQANTNVEMAAINSRLARQELARRAIDYTLQHPLFGVGPGQMTDVNGRDTKTSWRQGVWQDAHNTFLQASSECGIPALIFLTAGYVSTWLRLRATHRKARRRPDCQDIRTATFCLMLGMAGFTVSAFFLNFAYLFYAPAMAGMAIAVSSSAGREFESRSAAGAERPESAMPYPSARWVARG